MPHPLPRFPICTYGHEGCDVRGHHLHPRRPDFDSRVRVNAWCDAVNETGIIQRSDSRVLISFEFVQCFFFHLFSFMPLGAAVVMTVAFYETNQEC